MASVSGPSSSNSASPLGLIQPQSQRALEYFSRVGPDSICKHHRIRSTTDLGYARMQVIFNASKEVFDELLDQFLAGKTVESVKRFDAVVERFQERYQQKNKDASKAGVVDPVLANIRMARDKVNARTVEIASSVLSDFDLIDVDGDGTIASSIAAHFPTTQFDVATQTLEAARRFYMLSLFTRNIEKPVAYESFGMYFPDTADVRASDLSDILTSYSLPVLVLALNQALDQTDDCQHEQIKQMINVHQRLKKDDLHSWLLTGFNLKWPPYETSVVMQNEALQPTTKWVSSNPATFSETEKLRRRIAGTITVESEGIVSTAPVDFKEYFGEDLVHFETFLKLTAMSSPKDRSRFLRRFIDNNIPKELVMAVLDRLFKACESARNQWRTERLTYGPYTATKLENIYRPVGVLLSEAADFVVQEMNGKQVPFPNTAPPAVQELVSQPSSSTSTLDPLAEASAPSLYPVLDAATK